MAAAGQSDNMGPRLKPSCFAVGVIAAAVALAVVVGAAWGNAYLAAGAVFYGSIALVLWAFRPSARLLGEPLFSLTGKKKTLVGTILILEIAACTIPMQLNPHWNMQTVDQSNDHLDQKRIDGFAFALPTAAIAIMGVSLLFVPAWGERYNMDIYYLFGIAAFLGVGCSCCVASDRGRRWMLFAVGLLVVQTCLSAVEINLIPFDYSLTELYPWWIERLDAVVHLRL